LTVPRSIATLPRMRIIAYLLSPPDARAPVVQVSEYGACFQTTPGRRNLLCVIDC
jgi:hypothetical protein